MGDIIHTLPALTDAKNVIHDLEVDWVVEKAFSEIPRWHPAVKRIIPIELRRWRKSLYQKQTWQEWSQYKAELQAVSYDAIIDAQGLVKSALFAMAFTKGKKYGYDRHSAREGLSAFFYDETFSISYQQHAVERIRQLFAKALGYELSQTQGNYGIADFLQKRTACCESFRVPTILAVHSTTREDKHWQESYWAKLFSLLDTQSCEIHLPWGNEIERLRAERLAQVSPKIKVLPKLTLTALAEHMAMVDVVISVDTGLSHLAAALNKPNIILYGATDPKLIGAYGQNQYYLQADSMSGIFPEQVVEKLNELHFNDFTDSK